MCPARQLFRRTDRWEVIDVERRRPPGGYGDEINAANSLYLEPGVTTLVHFGTAFVGLDANLLVLPGHPYVPTGTFHAQVGMRF